MNHYSQAPKPLGNFSDLDLIEYQFVQYLPIFMPDSPNVRIPKNLYQAKKLRDMIHVVVEDQGGIDSLVREGKYVYITTRNGFATPGNPLNRPGWHCDGFGSDDTNYIWWNRWGTRFAAQPFHDINPGHVESMRQFEEQVDPDGVYTPPDGWLYRLTPYVVHSTPEIPAPGGERQFVKISVSKHRYNLRGNTHNFLFAYNWKMWPRDVARNHPVYGETDFYPESEA